MPIRRRTSGQETPGAARSFPSKRICPELMGSRPLIVRRSVDLPQPEGPMMTTTSPSATSRGDAAQGVVSAGVGLVEVDEAQLRVGGQFCHVFSMWRERSEIGQQMRKYSAKIRP